MTLVMHDGERLCTDARPQDPPSLCPAQAICRTVDHKEEDTTMLPEWVHALIAVRTVLGTTIISYEGTFATALTRIPRRFGGVSVRRATPVQTLTARVGDHDGCRTTLPGASSVITLTSARLPLLQMKRVAAARHDVVHTLRAMGAVRA
jgi:hypothetical protein